MKTLPAEGSPILPDGSTNASLPPRRIGEVLLELGKLNLQQIDEILMHQASNRRRFGDLAIALGFVTDADIDLAVVRQRIMWTDAEPDAAANESARLGVEPLPLAVGELKLPPLGPRQNESLRAVRAQLIMSWFGDEIEQHTLAIVSPDRGDGRSHVCAHLARLIAELEEEVLIIDADLRHPNQHALFGVEGKVGLSNYLSREVRTAPLTAVPGLSNLHLLPAGSAPGNSSELLGRRQFGLLIEELAARYRYILIDTPAANDCGDGFTVAIRSSGCLVVARAHRSRLADVQSLAERMTANSIEVLGAVINDR